MTIDPHKLSDRVLTIGAVVYFAVLGFTIWATNRMKAYNEKHGNR